MANGPAARTVPGSPRIYPAGKAVILLAACSPELAGRRLTVDGRRVQAIRSGRLALLVAYVDQQSYAPAEIERRRAEPAWFAAEARLLEQAVERAGAHGQVLPMPPLTVFTHPAALEHNALAQAARWTRGLARFAGKRECAVHAFVGPHVPPGGAPYVARITRQAVRSGKPPAITGSSAVTAHASALWRAVTALGIATRGVPVGDVRGALWSAVVLLEEADVPALAAAVDGSADAGTPLGVTPYMEIPRSPFSFV
jgi:hypothetical protein